MQSDVCRASRRKAHHMAVNLPLPPITSYSIFSIERSWWPYWRLSAPSSPRNGALTLDVFSAHADSVAAMGSEAQIWGKQIKAAPITERPMTDDRRSGRGPVPRLRRSAPYLSPAKHRAALAVDSHHMARCWELGSGEINLIDFAADFGRDRAIWIGIVYPVHSLEHPILTDASEYSETRGFT